MEIKTKFNKGDKVMHGNFKGKVKVVWASVDGIGLKIAYVVENVDTEETKDFYEQDLEPCPQSILTDKEKEYLKNVINPFRDRVLHIKKNVDDKREYIVISVKNEIAMIFPYFKKRTMYKGMKTSREYTLEELCL